MVANMYTGTDFHYSYLDTYIFFLLIQVKNELFSLNILGKKIKP